jgi:hypothetical protein
MNQPSIIESTEPTTEEAHSFIGTATLSAEDNKIRITPFRRLDAETYVRVKAAGFAWAPRQEVFVAPMWTPAREDLAVELCGDLEDEDTTLEERAAARAERFEESGRAGPPRRRRPRPSGSLSSAQRGRRTPRLRGRSCARFAARCPTRT